MLVVPRDGTLALMQFLAAGRQLSPFAALFTNNVTPDHTATLATFAEATFAGYHRVAMGPPTGAALLPSGATRLTWPQVVCGAIPLMPIETVYGVFVVQLDASLVLRLLWCEKLTPKMSLPIPTLNLVFTPVFDFSTLFG
jgi:hypothetical protein